MYIIYGSIRIFYKIPLTNPELMNQKPSKNFSVEINIIYVPSFHLIILAVFDGIKLKNFFSFTHIIFTETRK
jgi:hypothetical protein